MGDGNHADIAERAGNECLPQWDDSDIDNPLELYGSRSVSSLTILEVFERLSERRDTNSKKRILNRVSTQTLK